MRTTPAPSDCAAMVFVLPMLRAERKVLLARVVPDVNPDCVALVEFARGIVIRLKDK